MSREEVMRTVDAVDKFVSTMLKLGLADHVDLLNFKSLNLPWYASKTASLRMTSNQRTPQQQRESETLCPPSEHFLSDSNKES